MTPNVDALLTQLTLEEKVSLLAARDWWRTPVIQREEVFVPHIKVWLDFMVVVPSGEIANTGI